MENPTSHLAGLIRSVIANIAYRVGETLRFNGKFEEFIDNEEADMMLTRFQSIRFGTGYVINYHDLP